MSLYTELQNKISNVDISITYDIICKNVKKFRLQKYNEYKQGCSNNTLNPYSTENISALLNYNHNHYKRFESENDTTNRIPLEKLIKLCIILDKKLDDFLRDDN